MRGKGVFFMRNVKPGEKINQTVVSDDQVLFGEISEHTVGVLKTLINNVYKPLLTQMAESDWKQCEADQ